MSNKTTAARGMGEKRASSQSQKQLSLSPVLQDFSVSSLTDLRNDIHLPSDSSLNKSVAHFEMCPSNVHFNKSEDLDVFVGPYHADSTLMDITEPKPQEPLFKNPPLRKNTKRNQKARPSLFDSIMEDSDTDTPEQKTHRPFHREKKTPSKIKSFKIDSSVENLSFSNENIIISDSPPNFITRRKARQKQTIDIRIFDKAMDTSASDNSFCKGPALKRHPTLKDKKNTSKFEGVFDESCDSPANQTIGSDNILNDLVNNPKLDISSKSPSQNVNLISKKIKRNIPKSLTVFDDIFNNTANDSKTDYTLSEIKQPKSIRDAKKSGKTIDSKLFDSDLNTSESFQLSSSHCASNKNDEEKEINCEENLKVDSRKEKSVDPTAGNRHFNVSLIESNKEDIIGVNVSVVNYSDCGPDAAQLGVPILDNILEGKTQLDEMVVGECLVYEDQSESKVLSECQALASSIDSIKNSSFFVEKSTLKEYITSDPSESPKLNPCFELNEKENNQMAVTHDSCNTDISPHQDESSNKSENINHNTPSKFSDINESSSSKIQIFDKNTALKGSNNQDVSNDQEKCIITASSHNSQEINLIVSANDDYSDAVNFLDKTLLKLNSSHQSSVSKSLDVSKVNIVSKEKRQSFHKKRVSFKPIVSEELEYHKDSVISNSFMKDKSSVKFSESQSDKNYLSIESLRFDDGLSSEMLSEENTLDLCASGSNVNSLFYSRNNTITNENITDSHASKNMFEDGGSSLTKGGDEFHGESRATENDTEQSITDNNLICEDEDQESEENANEEGKGSEDVKEVTREENSGNSLDGEDARSNTANEVDYSLKDSQGMPEESQEEEMYDKYSEDQKSNSCTTTPACKTAGRSYSHSQESYFDGQESAACLEESIVSPTNNLRSVFKKPGPFTVFSDSLPTPNSKRTVQEMLDAIPLSELRNKKKSTTLSSTSKEQMEHDKIEEILKRRQRKEPAFEKPLSKKLKKPHKYISSRVYEFIIVKLEPDYRLKSRVEAEKVVSFLSEQVKTILKGKQSLFELVREMKLQLTSLNIIKTDKEFFNFIKKYFDGIISEKVCAVSIKRALYNEVH